MTTIPSSVLSLTLRNADHFKRLPDPFDALLYHAETLLPFSEAAKLERGNANVRPPGENRPLKAMMETVDNDPQSFHLKNRGITYLCQRFQFENGRKQLLVTVPKVVTSLDDLEELGVRFGIADGGHTAEVIRRTVNSLDTYRQQEGWEEPFVRVRFLATDLPQLREVEQVVEALNTSLQVQQYTLDEYSNAFEELKEALEKAGFPTQGIAFRENEDKEWHVIEIIQRLACFLKDRWKLTQPASMYRSKTKALALYKDEETRGEFRKLFDVIKDVVTLPEFIQAEFGSGVVPRKSFARLKCVKPLPKPYTRPGTPYETDYKMDIASVLPIAAAFRELLTLRGDRYFWRVDPKEVFRRAQNDLYAVLLTRIGRARVSSTLGSDMEYWSACVTIVMRVKDQMLEERFAEQGAT